MALRNNILIFLGLFAFLFILNFLFPAQVDDFGQYEAATDGRGFFAAYFGWNGRIGEILWAGYLARFVHSPIFDFLNALVGSFFIFIVYFFIFAKLPKDKEDYYLFMIWCSSLFLLSSFGSFFLWGAGSLNYLWGLTFVGLFLIPYRICIARFLGEENIKISYSFYRLIMGISFGAFAILAGMASEFLGFIISLFLIVSICYVVYKKIKLPFWYIFGSFGFFIGWIILYLSPGSRSRGERYSLEGKFVSIQEFFDMSILDKFFTINNAFNNGYSHIYIVFLLVFVIFYIYKKWNFIKLYHIVLLFVGFGIALPFTKHICGLLVYGLILYAMYDLTKNDKKYQYFIGLFVLWLFINLILIQMEAGIAKRAKLGRDFPLLIIIFVIAKEFYFINTKRALQIVSGFFIFGITFVSGSAFEVYYKWNDFKEYVKNEKALGHKDIVIEDRDKYFPFQRYFKDYTNVGRNPKSFPNPDYAKYFGVDSIRVK